MRQGALRLVEDARKTDVSVFWVGQTEEGVASARRI
jgi:hypothetical protein